MSEKLECGETIIKKKTLGDNNPIHSTCITIIIIQNTRFMKKNIALEYMVLKNITVI